VADAFDSMATDRPYRRRLSEEKALKELQACSGTQFDPLIVEAFVRAYRKGFILNRSAEEAQMLG